MDPQHHFMCRTCGSRDIVKRAPTPDQAAVPEADRELNTDLPPLYLDPNEKGIIFYTLGVTDDRVSFFVPSCIELIDKTRAEIPLDGIQEGQIYHVSNLTSSYIGEITAPSELTLKKYTNRYEFVCQDPTAYRELILQPLLLGCRVRDYEQRRATVSEVAGALELRMPPQGRRLDEITLKTALGETFTRGVKQFWTEGDAEKIWFVVCDDSDEPLPDVIVQGSHLEIVGGINPQSRVTSALFRSASGHMPIDFWPLLSHIYGRPSTVVQPTVALSLIRTDPSIRLSDGGVITLNDLQASAINHYNCSAVRALAIEAPPGSGKTLTAAAMAVSYKGKGVQLFLSTANAPVFNIAYTLNKLGYGTRSIIHLISSEGVEKIKEMPSPFSSLSLAKKDNALRAMIDQLDAMLLEVGDDEEKKRKIKETQHFIVCKPILQQPHDIYLSTVDYILNRLFKFNQLGAHNEDTVKKQLKNDVERVVVDEASQLTEAALNALVLCFPKAQIVLIGDSKQLPPFRYHEGMVAGKLAARSALDVVKDKRNVPVITLTEVYRAPANIIRHYNHNFYEGRLLSKKATAAGNPLACLLSKSNTKKNIRCIFWKVKNGVCCREGTSKFNYQEVNALYNIVRQLTASGIPKEDIMIVCYYESQRVKVMSNEFKGEQLMNGYEVLTVDSGQGREKRIVIVLTTRSSVPENPDEYFFTCPKRLNVALSRHQQALIVIGHPSIAEAPTWVQVLDKKYFHHYDDNRGTIYY